VLLGVLTVDRAAAIFIPGVRRLSIEESDRREEERYWDTVMRRMREAFFEPVGGLAVNLDCHDGTQTLSSSLPAPASLEFESESAVTTYTIRPEIVWTNWLSTYAIGGLHEGTNKSDFASLDLDGWAAGAGVALALGLPPYEPYRDSPITYDPFFLIPDFNWTHNEFDDISNTVHVFNLTTRIGAGARTDRYNWAFYAGPMYQSSTKDLIIKPLGNLEVESEPEDAWSGVIGAVFGVRFPQDSKNLRGQERPTMLLTMEGGVGNRPGILVSLRYEYDFFNRPH
jgi:hypothetical protein